MALIRAGGGAPQKPEKQRKKKPKREQILARKSRTPSIYPPQKSNTKTGGTPSFVPHDERGRPKEDRNIPAYLRPNEPLETPDVTGGARFDPRQDWSSTEGMVRNITDSYFKANKSLPDTVTVAQMMSDPKFAPRSKEQFDALWEPIMEATDPETPYIMAGDFFQMDNTRDALNKLAMGAGIKVESKVLLDPLNNPVSDTPLQPNWDTINKHLEVVRSHKRSRYPDMSDFLIGQSELGKLYSTYYDRLVERGEKPLFAKDSIEYDPDFDYAVRKGAFGRQLGYALNWNTPQAAVIANDVIRNLRQGGFGTDFITKTAQELGVPADTQIGNFDTVAGLLSALQVDDSDLIRQIVWDGWEFGRPVGQTKSQARREYVAAFGKNRLPQEQAELYNKENRGVLSLIDTASNVTSDALAVAKRVPYVGDAIAPIGNVVGQIDAIMFAPIQWSLQACTTVGGVYLQASQGWDWNTYQKELADHGGAKGMDREHDISFDWGKLTDLSTWANAWEDASGRMPLTLVAENFDLRQDGRLGAAAGQLGQLADFGVMMFVGSKFDAFTWGHRVKNPKTGVWEKQPGVMQGVGQLSWDAARATHKLGWQIYKYQSARDFYKSGQAGFIFVSSPTALVTKQVKKMTGGKDYRQPPVITGIGSLRRPDGSGVFVRVVDDSPISEARKLQKTLIKNQQMGARHDSANVYPGEQATAEDILDTGKADLAAREGNMLAEDVGGGVIVRPLTWNEFRLIEPPIPGVQFRGGKISFNPRTSSYGRWPEGRGMYTTDDVYAASEYAAGKTGRGGVMQYVEGAPNNPIDFDEAADETFWAKIIEDSFMRDGDGNAAPEITDGKWTDEISEDTAGVMAKMKKELDWERGAADPKHERLSPDHTGSFVDTVGPVKSGEVFKWLVHYLDNLALGRPDKYVDADRMLDAIQKNIVKRGYDAQIHTEGLRRGDPHRVTVWFEEAVKGEYTRTFYEPDKLLEVRARRQLLTEAAHGTNPNIDIDTLPTKIGNEIMKMEEDFFAGKIDSVDIRDRIDDLISDDKLWSNMKYEGARPGKNPFDDQDALVHSFDMNGRKFEAYGDQQDLDHIPGGVKRTNVRLLSEDEAYERYLESFEDTVIQHADDANNPLVREPISGKKGGTAELFTLIEDFADGERQGDSILYEASNVEIALRKVNDRKVTLSRIAAREEAAAGAGNEAMDELLGWADRHGVYIDLEPKGFRQKGFRSPMSQADLEDWYTRKDFKPTKDGRMVRAPKSTGPAGHAGTTTIDLLTGGLIMVSSSLPNGRPNINLQSYCPPKWLSTNAELLVNIDNPYTIVKLYGITNDSDEVKGILKNIAKQKDPGLIEQNLRLLEQHGITIDSGAAAAVRGARLGLMEKGIGDVGWSRVFTTMTTYGKTQPIEHAADNVEQVGKAIKLGGNMSKKDTLKHLRRLSEKAWDADDGHTQAVVDEMWDLFEKNLGTEGMQKFKDFQRSIYHARGQKYILHLRRRAYLGGKKNGEPMETSLVVDPKLRERLPAEQAHALDKFNEVRSAETKRLESRVRFLEDAMMKRHGSTTPRKGSTLSGDLTRTRQQLDDLNRLAQGAVHPDIVQAQRDIAALAGRLGANEKELARLAESVRDATTRTQKYADAAAVLERLGGKKRLRQTVKAGEKFSEQDQWDNAIRDMEEFRTSQPFKMGQTRKHIVHRYDPRIAGWYMSGKPVQTFMKFDQAIAEPLIRLFKETVMATFGFPVRVNVGDELVRLIPEGVFQRYRSKDRRDIRKTVIDELGNEHAFDSFDVELAKAIAGDWETTGNPDDWTLLMPMDEGFYPALKDDIRSWAAEPIVIRLINDKLGGVGNFPTDVKGIRRFIKKLRDETDSKGNLTDDAKAIRAHLNDTHRTDTAWKTRNGKKVLEDVFDTRMFQEWCDGWAERMTVIAENKILRDAMTGDIDLDELVKWGNANPEKLWPVNAPSRLAMNYGLRTGNPLYVLPKLSPFHYVYQYGTVKALSIIGQKTKTALFNDRYYTLRNEILAKSPNMDKNELHRLCGEAALKYADQAAYSRSTTMFEDMARNMLPFVSAYRQFWLYWGKLALTHPFTMSTVRQAYPDLFNDPFRFANDDYQFLIPQIPFWGPQPEEGDKGMWGLMKGQSPSFSFVGVLPMRVGLSLIGEDPQNYANKPMLGSLDHAFAPYKRLANLSYGLGLTGPPPDSLEWLFGDGDKMEKAHINAVLTWMRYGDNPTGAEVQEDLPIWAQLINKLPGTQHPEAVWGEFIKTGMPIGTYYSPEGVRNRQNWLAEYGALKDEKAKALYRMNNKWIDTYLDYYEADNEGKVALKLDPANSEFLKWWASPYDYDLVGDIVDPADFQSNMLDTGRKRRDEEYLKRYIHNLYTDVYGGVYVPLGEQSGGVEYKGDIAKQKAVAKLEADLKKANTWGRDVSHALHLKYGWDEKRLLYDFQHPGGIQENGDRTGWGIWNSIMRERGLNPYEYDINNMSRMFAEDWGSEELKTTAYNASSDELLKAFGLTNWLPNPKLAKDFRESSGDIPAVQTSRKQLKQDITEFTTKIASDQWYYLKADQLNVIGIKADPKIDVVQLELKKSWDKWHTYKAGTDEYKAARNDYYEEQRKKLGKLEGGDAIIGGLADRLEHIPYFTKPNLISVGSGRQAARQAAAWDDYVKVRNQELAKDSPNKAKIDKAWEAFAGVSNDKGSPGIEKKMLEKGRVRMWHFILETADEYRKILLNSDSDYYEAKGNSVASKFGQQYAKAISQTIKNAMEANPLFKKDVETYFSDPDYLGTHLIDWYNY